MSELTEDELETFRRLLRAMGSSRGEFVVAGGQASRLLRLHPNATRLDWAPILTTDIDVATRLKGHTTQHDLGKALADEGFTAEFLDTELPPVTHYVRGTTEVEFIVPVVPERRASGPVVRLFGINAQKVDNLDLILEDVIEVELDKVGSIRVPSPAAYILQKTLTLTNRRELAKKGKDALYVHDAMRLFLDGASLHPFLVDAARALMKRLPQSRATMLTNNARKPANARTDFVVEASKQAQGRRSPHTPEVLAAFMKLTFIDLLGEEMR